MKLQVVEENMNEFLHNQVYKKVSYLWVKIQLQ